MPTFCSNCGNTLAPDIKFCPNCGTVSSSYSGSSQSDPTVLTNSSQQKVPTDYGSPPYGLPESNPYEQFNPYEIISPPPPPPRQIRSSLIVGIISSIVVSILILGVVGTFVLLPLKGRNTSVGSVSSSQSCGGAFSDEFNGNLHSGWSWVDPINNSTHSVMDQGFLRIVTPHSNKDFYPDTNFNAPRLLQPISGNFTIETRIHFNPTYTYTGAGILVWENDTSFIRLERAYGEFSGFEFNQYANSTYIRIQSTSHLENPGPHVTATLVDLRLERNGITFIASWRNPSSSQDWQSLGNTSIHFGSIQVGLILVAQAWEIPDFATSADYDYFRVSCL